jgi:acyl-[acyl carrier protein]--UDP-N-acetylglucosamine O-acyltransferase
VHSLQLFSAVPQDLKFGGEESLAIIGDNCTIREWLPSIEVQLHQVKLLLEITV